MKQRKSGSDVVQKFGDVKPMNIGLTDKARRDTCAALNKLLADTMTLRDLYKKHHWQVSGSTFYELHLLFDKHYEQQSELVDLLAERVQTLGGVSVAMAHDVAEMTRIKRPPNDRENTGTQIRRLLDAHKLIIESARKEASAASDRGDEGTNDLIVSEVVRTNEMQAWFVTETGS